MGSRTPTDDCGLETTIVAPRSFRWSDGSIPTTVTITNRSQRAWLLDGLQARLGAPTGRRRNGWKVTLDDWDKIPPAHLERIELGPGESATRPVVVSASLESDPRYATSPGCVQAFARVMFRSATRDVRRISLLARPMVAHGCPRPGQTVIDVDDGRGGPRWRRHLRIGRVPL